MPTRRPRPICFDLTGETSPHRAPRGEACAEHTFDVGAPGATSANLKRLGLTIPARTIDLLDEG